MLNTHYHYESKQQKNETKPNLDLGKFWIIGFKLEVIIIIKQWYKIIIVFNCNIFINLQKMLGWIYCTFGESSLSHKNVLSLYNGHN